MVGAAYTHQSQAPAIIEANTEIDSHADTCCLGANFTPLYFTSKICNVTPFLDSLPSATNVEICTGATAYDDANGTTLILIVNKALWLGDCMQHSLLNPYQIRAHGIHVCDDPTNTQRPFGIQIEEAQVNFKMLGTTCAFRSRTPTAWELVNCQHVELTSDVDWSPNEPHFGLEFLPEYADAPVSISAYDT